ncbi:ribonuclease E inhibitor RraA/Dimethylmenaquinone methyltransferase [Kalaharituber pfeilii]|nr:ribonuclease E inhibitor RraA/Dimethylmenaquinone methyltransferase [Kalaharituber pfeilii]
MTDSQSSLDKQLQQLKQYSACDISDALLKLKVPEAGFIADMVLRNPSNPSSPTFTTPIAAPACTVLFLPKSTPPPPTLVTPTAHFADQLTPDTIVVISQPPDQRNAVVGGIVAARMHKIGAKGVVVDGRVRDLAQLEGKMPVFSRAISTVSTSAASVFHAINIPIILPTSNITVNPGDIIFISPSPDAAAVCIPRTLLSKVLEILPAMVSADKLALDDVESGVPITEAFRLRRG